MTWGGKNQKEIISLQCVEATLPMSFVVIARNLFTKVDITFASYGVVIQIFDHKDTASGAKNRLLMMFLYHNFNLRFILHNKLYMLMYNPKRLIQI